METLRRNTRRERPKREHAHTQPRGGKQNTLSPMRRGFNSPYKTTETKQKIKPSAAQHALRATHAHTTAGWKTEHHVTRNGGFNNPASEHVSRTCFTKPTTRGRKKHPAAQHASRKAQTHTHTHTHTTAGRKTEHPVMQIARRECDNNPVAQRQSQRT
jgi:hypothetical protein